MNDTVFYLVASAQGPNGGIWRFRSDAGSGKFEKAGFSGLAGANYLAAAPDMKHIYASGSDAEHRGYVAAFRVETDGSLTLLKRLDTNGKGCCHLCISPEGERLYAANYWSGSVAGFVLGSDGTLSERAEFDQHTGHGVDPDRQEAPHPHFCGFTPDGKFLLVNDLGLDEVFAYPYSAARGIDTAAARRTAILPEGSGPRHLLFEPEGSCLLVTEMGNSIQRLEYDGQGGFHRLAAASTLPGQKWGYVFHRCTLTAAPGVDKCYLGRPWGAFARTVFLECELGAHILPQGWRSWNKPDKPKTEPNCYYAEWGSTGPGADAAGRVPWSHQLIAQEAAEYTFANVMYQPQDGIVWNPYMNR